MKWKKILTQNLGIGGALSVGRKEIKKQGCFWNMRDYIPEMPNKIGAVVMDLTFELPTL